MKLYFKIKKRIIKAQKFVYNIRMILLILPKLKKMGIVKIRFYKYKNWHIGFCYFTGSLNGERVFIKVDTHLKFLSNEKRFYDDFIYELGDYLIPLKFFKEFPSFQVAVFKFINESSRLNDTFLIENKDLLIEMLNILTIINKKNVIHRDIKIDNFMLDDDKLRIIDFTFANSFIPNSRYKELNINKVNENKILKDLCGQGKISDYEWNDFYSLKVIIDKLLLNDNISNVDKVEIIKILNIVEEKIKNTSYTIG